MWLLEPHAAIDWAAFDVLVTDAINVLEDYRECAVHARRLIQTRTSLGTRRIGRDVGSRGVNVNGLFQTCERKNVFIVSLKE